MARHRRKRCPGRFHERARAFGTCAYTQLPPISGVARLATQVCGEDVRDTFANVSLFVGQNGSTSNLPSKFDFWPLTESLVTLELLL